MTSHEPSIHALEPSIRPFLTFMTAHKPCIHAATSFMGAFES